MEYSEENLKSTSTADLKAMYDIISTNLTEAEFMYERASEVAIGRLIDMKKIVKAELVKRILNIFPL